MTSGDGSFHGPCGVGGGPHALHSFPPGRHTPPPSSFLLKEVGFSKPAHALLCLQGSSSVIDRPPQGACRLPEEAKMHPGGLCSLPWAVCL